MAEAKCRAFCQIEAFLPCFRLVYDLKLDMFLQVGRAHFFADARKYGLAGALDHRIPILLGACVKVSNRDKNIKRILPVGCRGRVRA